MSLLGADLSAEYQPGFDVGRAYAEGMRFLSVKLSDGTKGTDRYEEGIDVIAAARARRMVTFGYHYIRPDVSPEFQGRMFADQLRRAGDVAGVLDVEQGGADLAREVQYHTVRAGGRVVLTYLPRWYWAQIGSPVLSGLPPLWGSRYVSTNRVEDTGPPGELVKRVDPTWFDGYGSRAVEILQFSSKAMIAGRAMDGNVYRGSLAELERMADGA